jgi:hypothetical protein
MHTRLWWGESEGKRSFVRPRRRWEFIIDIRYMGREGMEWIDLA